MQRTTIRMEAGLLQAAKRLGIESGRTLTEVITDAVREAVVRPARRQQGQVKLPVSKQRGGVQAGVDLSRSGELLERMEARADRA